MALPRGSGLNDSGEPGVARLLSRAAIHLSRGQRTSRHAHYAWKLHLGLDAPVWLESGELTLTEREGVRGILIPPNFEHTTGAFGCSIAVFLSPGSRRTPFRDDGRPRILDSRQVERLLRLGPLDADLSGGVDFVDATAQELFPCGSIGVDSRVAHCLQRLLESPEHKLGELAAEVGVSLDHLSRLVRRDTGLVLRRHVLWSRLLHALAQPPGNVASMAQAAGFADHAHMTRTFRAFLGRVPSEFQAPPEVIAPW